MFSAESVFVKKLPWIFNENSGNLAKFLLSRKRKKIHETVIFQVYI